jgi:hypothetical protein
MIRNIVAARGLVVVSVAAVVGTCGVFVDSVDAENPFLGLIALQNLRVFRMLTYEYEALWFTTSFFAASLGLSVLAIVASRAPERMRPRAIAALPRPASRPTPALVLGEAHRARTYGLAPTPAWMTVPQRGLYTASSFSAPWAWARPRRACIRTSIQLLRWKAGDQDRKLGGLVRPRVRDWQPCSTTCSAIE